MYVAHCRVQGLFGPDEERLADFIATVAGAALENADGFQQLQQLNETLELRVTERTTAAESRARELAVANRDLERTAKELSHANLQLSLEIGERRRTEAELQTVHRQFVEAARRAGMAEVATGVLHNVGNVLNSVNVSTTLVGDRLRKSKLAELTRVLNLMDQHAADLGDYLTRNEQGKRLPGFLRLVADHLNRDQAALLEELDSLTKNVNHIKTIVAMQQSYAGASGVVEPASLAELIDDALRLDATSFERNHVQVVRDYADVPNVQMDKQKVLQILVNLLTNAKDSLLESSPDARRMTIRIRVDGQSQPPRVVIEVTDNGVGIPREHLKRVFSHGFTTKKHGHGFGLHSSANAAKELGGTITVYSDGPGRGAIFTVTLPFKPIEVPK